MIGKILKERYKIYDKVGSGGVASVFIARDLQTYEVVAVKILKEEYTSNPNFIKRFIREAEVVSTLHHQNITAVKDFGVEDNQYFIVMEYVEGKMLAQIVEEKGCIPPEQTIDVIIQVLSALEYAWENGIVAHRDIKPQNIMLDKNGVIKVMDFGIARVSSSHTMTQAGTFLGTPYYMSPEQAQGKETDIRSDIYSVGISIFQLVCGKVPFDADTPWSVVNMHITQAPPCVQIGPPYENLCKVIDKSLAKKVEDRYQTPKEMQEDLEAIKKGSSLIASNNSTMAGSSAIGELYISSTPPGARVYIGQELKGVTPTLLRNLPAKSYKVKIEKEGFKTEEKSCNVSSNKRTVLEQSLKATVSKQNSSQTMVAMNTNQTYVGEAPQSFDPHSKSMPVQSRKPPIFLWGILGVLVLAMIIGGIFLIKPKGSKPQETDYSKQPTNTVNSGNSNSNSTDPSGGYGKIAIESEPTGAEIYVDGTALSEITPFVMQNVPSGKHDVSVILNNQKASQTIQVSPGEIKKVKLIIPVQTENQIEISSNPSGASIFLDGKDTGYKSPKVIDKIEKGIHEVKLVLIGYESFEIQVNVIGKATVSANLVKSGTPQGSVAFTSNPSGAKVSINGKPMGTTPVTITLTPGSYTAIFTLTGYKEEKKTFEIKTDQQTNITVNLIKIETPKPPPTNPPPKPPPTTPPKPPVETPKTGVLRISTTPSGAEVYINGSFKGMSPLTLTLSNGSYSIKVVLEGYESASKTVTVYGGQTSNASFQLNKKSSGPAKLRIFSTPDSAEVYIDGNLVGLTDDTFIVSSGTHKILIRLEGYKDFVMTITVKEGETRDIRASLIPK